MNSGFRTKCRKMYILGKIGGFPDDYISDIHFKELVLEYNKKVYLRDKIRGFKNGLISQSIKMDKTIDYYENNADSFAAGTVEVDFADVQDRFLSYLPDAGTVLDFGCGSGRDTKYFIEKGYTVDATDGSEKLCKIAGKYTGIDVRHMLFSELDADMKYDGIWACSSILHLPKDELKTVIAKMIRAVRPGGYIYSSFKYGEFEGFRNNRYFTDFTSESFHILVKDFPEITIIEEWISSDVRPGRSEEKWLNLIMQKK